MRIGIDLGGTKIEGIALGRGGAELARRRVATPRGDYDGSLRAIADLVAWLESETGARGTVGVGMPGAISPATGLVKNANSTWLNGRPFDRDLASVLGRPVRVENDANCFAVSEATDGAAAGAHVVFGAILGTGAGGGIVVDGRPLKGRNAVSGEWGHIPLPWARDDERPGPECYCGLAGCLETWISGTGLEWDFARATGETASGVEVARRAEAGDAAAAAALDRYVDRLARALAVVVNVLDPDVIVLGGGMSNVATLYERVPARLPRWCFSDRVDTPVRRALHGDSSGVRGAAWLWQEES